MSVLSTKLEIVDSCGNVFECEANIEKGEPCRIQLYGEHVELTHFEGEDLFVCLTNIRLELEKKGFLVACNGAREDVYPSGMSRQMSLGSVAYITSLGNPTQRKNLVNIFEPTLVDKVTSVGAQKEYHEKWLKSLEM